MAFVKTADGRNACASGGWLQAMAGGSLKVYTTAHGTLLATFTLDSPAYTGPSTGVLTMAGSAKVATPVANGSAAVYDACKSDGTVLGSGTVTATGGGGDMILNNIALVTTSNVTLSTHTHTEPAS
jgi:hypothetical protein